MNLGLVFLAYWHPKAVLVAGVVVLSAAGLLRRVPRYRRLLEQLSFSQGVAPFTGAGRSGRMSVINRALLFLVVVVIGLVALSTVRTYFGLVDPRLP